MKWDCVEWNELRKIHPGLPEKSEGYHRHEYGGGWVSDDSEVSTDSFVGGDCVVDGGSKLCLAHVGHRSWVHSSVVAGCSGIVDGSWVDGSHIVDYTEIVDGSHIVDSRISGSKISDSFVVESLISGGSLITTRSRVSGSAVSESVVSDSEIDGPEVVDSSVMINNVIRPA